MYKDERQGAGGAPTSTSKTIATKSGRGLADAIIGQIARERNISPDLLLSPTRCARPIAEARQQAMYLAHVAAGMTMSAVGEVFGRDRTTIRHACACVEDLRDDLEFDAYISGLEAEIEALKERAI